MSRIRTVKPELFKHEDLFDAEQNSQLPLRLAFIGLFTVADREGRFKWRPRTLKLDVLPHDFIDFAAVLDALERAGFIERYEVDGEIYGWIPTFTRHQRFSGKESESKSQFPPPPPRGSNGEATGKHPDASPTLPSEATGKREGTQEWNKERNMGRERNMDASAPITPMPPVAPITEPVPAPDQTTTPQASIPEEFEALWREYPPRNGGNPKPTALKAWNARRKEGHSAAEMRAGVQRYAAWCAATGKLNTEFIKQTSTFLGPEKGFLEAWDLPITPAQPPRPSPPSAMTPEGAEFDAILRNLSRPVIEGEIAHELH